MQVVMGTKIRVVAMLAGLALLAGCGSEVVYDVSAPTYEQAERYSFSANDIRVTQQPAATPALAVNEKEVSSSFPLSPAESVRAWANTRLRAAGGQYLVEVLVRDASVIEEKLPLRAGIAGKITDEYSEKYHARLEVEVRIYDAGKVGSAASASTVVTMSRAIKEEATPAKRQAFLAAMNRELMQKFDRQMRQRIEQYLGQYLVMPAVY